MSAAPSFAAMRSTLKWRQTFGLDRPHEIELLARAFDDHAQSTAAPALLEALETEARAAELSAAIMRNQKRTGGWSGAEKTAQAFDRIAKNLRAAISLAKGESA